MNKIEIVIAGTYRQYKDYLRCSGKSSREAIYASEERQLLGRHGVKIIYVGEWWLNPAAHSDYLQILEQECMDVTES